MESGIVASKACLTTRAKEWQMHLICGNTLFTYRTPYLQKVYSKLTKAQ